MSFYIVVLTVFLNLAGAEDAACPITGVAERQRSLLQQKVASTVSLAEELQPQSEVSRHSVTPYPEQRPEEVQSKDQSLCEEDVFARPELCPARCPYAAEMQAEFCHFRCVQRQECGLLGTVENATIPDDKLMVCRHCNVEGCLHCIAAKPGEMGPRLEHCHQCMPGYWLTEEGECQMQGLAFFISCAVVFVVATILVILWYVIVASKPCVNPEGVAYGFEARQRMRLTDGATGEAFPLSTNLLSTNIAGPGTTALFRYQFALLIWASTLLLVWLCFVIFVSSDLLILGNRAAESPQMLCAIVEWGHHRQMELIWTKVAWLCFAYVFSFAGAMYYAVQQTKLFVRANLQHATMASFAAKLEGLPAFPGSEPVEEKLKSAITAATGYQPVAVSVSFDFADSKKTIETILEQEMEDPHEAQAPHGSVDEPPRGPLGKAEAWATSQVLNAWHVHLDHHHVSEEETKSLLKSLSTTSCAFVIFKNQEAQQKAIKAVAVSGVAVDRVACKLTPCKYAPEGLFWHNMGVTASQRTGKIAMAILGLAVACSIWTFILYIPYALYMSSFSYANGDEPGEFSEGLFICLVVGSQLGLFVVSSLGAKHGAFHSEDETQKAYTMYYNSALILNLIMDIALQTYLSYLQMVGVGAHTSDGRLLGSLDSAQEIFESYPVQKSMGKLLFVYCWPCTFFVPFLAEPFAVQWLPQHLAQYIVGANKKIKGENAEKAFELGEMEQGRFADCMFNVILVVCIPFISPAYMALTFAALIFSHIYLYVYDHVKVLRYVRKFNFSGPEVHWLGMQLFAIPVSILAGALVFKANQMSGDGSLGSGYFKGYSLGAVAGGAAVLHFVIHLLVLEFMVKPIGEQEEEHTSIQYAEAARTCPATYLSTNPIYCLRSKYILKHNPPQAFYAPGKEALAKTNPAIGAFYEFHGNSPKSKK